MERRPISENVWQWLTAELELWRSGGVLSTDQASRILDLYETPTEAAVRRRSVAMFTLSGIAALLIGLAALLAVSYNWQAMSASLKLGVLFGSLLALYAGAFTLRHHRRRLSAEIVFFLSCILYGTSIWLIAQIFHIQSHYPDGIWTWALGVLPFALCLDTVLLHALYAGLLAIWVGAEILGFTGVNRLFFFHWHVPGAAWTLPLMVLPGIVWAYKKKSVIAIGLYAPLLAWWAVLQPVAWQWNVNPISFVGLAGALMLLIAEMHLEGSRMAIPYRACGVLIVGGVLVPLSFADVIFEILHDGTVTENYVAALVVGLIGAAFALAVVVLQQRSESKSYAEIFRRQWLPLTLIALMAGLCVWSGLFNQYDPNHIWHGRSLMGKWSPQVLLPVAAFNAMMVVFALWLMRVGLREDRTIPFTVGVLYFLLWTVVRYVDLFAGVGGMLGAAILFLLCGLGLLAIVRFWSHRKDSARSMFQRLPDTQETPSIFAPAEASLSESPSTLRRAVLSGGVALQFCILVGMILLKAAPLWNGQTVLLRIVPVDPRDLFRGDYVTLAYDFSQVPDDELPELGKLDYNRRHEWKGKTVYVSLTPEEDGRHWRRSRISTQRPTEGLFLQGKLVGWHRIQCGIESFYVQEGQGREYEDAARTKRLSAEVAIAPDGRAVLRKLMIESPRPIDGPSYDPPGQSRWPTDTTYRVQYLPDAKITLDGRLDDSAWSRANVERHFVFPWKDTPAPPTEFMALCDRDYFYFAFKAEDSDIVVLDDLRDKLDILFEDRVELFLSCDHQMKSYYNLEIDSRGRPFDSHGSYYRQKDRGWHCEGFEAVGSTFDKGYIVEGRIPLDTFKAMGLPRLGVGDKILAGIYRAEFSHNPDPNAAPPTESIHHQSPAPLSPPPIEEWISWIDPKTPEPDFHVPSSLGWFEIVE